MKKLSQSPQNESVLNTNDVEPTIEYPSKEKQEEFVIDTVPPKTLKSLNNYNLKKIKSFKIIRKKYKLNNQTTMFIQDLSIILKEYEPTKFQLDTDMLVHICNIAEQYFIYGTKEEREEQKLLGVSTLMRPYFKNDTELLLKMMSIVYDKVNKTTLLKRIYRRLLNFFLNLKQN
jgi:hypothetical protein